MQIGFELDDVLCSPIKCLTNLEEISKAEVLPGAKDFLVELKKAGHQIVILTHRDSSTAIDTERFLDKNGIPFSHIMYNRPRNVFVLFAPDCRQFISWDETRKELEKYGILKETKKIEVESSPSPTNTGIQELKK
jgi:ribonucleotide monophosphatase NagD (HAD superfamily)